MDTRASASFAITAYPASAYIWLGDFQKAKVHAESAVAAHEDLPDAARSQGAVATREAIARIDLGIALAELGEPDEAASLGLQALGTPRLIHSVRSRAGDLDRTLAARYSRLSVVRDYHEAYAQTCRAITN